MRKLKLDELGRLSVTDFKAAEKAPFVVVLDSIRSKNNVGSVFRTCDAFRAAHLHLCGYTPAPPDRDIAKTSLGAEESVDWSHTQDAVALAQQLKADGYTLVSVEQAEHSVALPDFQAESGKRYAIVLGNEVGGVDQAIVDLSDIVLEIPQYGTKHSLNIAVATGIVLYTIAESIRRA